MSAKDRDPIPEHFKSAEAGEFWDTHSAADYLSNLEDYEKRLARGEIEW